MSTLALTIFFNVRYRLLRYAPTNILLIRTYDRHGLSLDPPGWWVCRDGECSCDKEE